MSRLILPAALIQLTLLLSTASIAQQPPPTVDTQEIFLGAGARGVGAGELVPNSWSNPPDPHGAIGPNSYVATVNYNVSIYDRQLNRTAFSTTRAFYGAGGEAYDQKVYFHEGRFWIFGISVGGLVYAKSRTDDPKTLTAADWDTFKVGQITDYPCVTPAKGGFLLTASTPWGVIFRLKTDGTLTRTNIPSQFHIGGTFEPAYDLATDGPLWLCRNKPGTNAKHLQILRVDDPFGTPTYTEHLIEIFTMFRGRVPLQPGGTVPSGGVVGNAMAQTVNGRQYVASCLCVGYGAIDMPCRCHWFQLDVTSGTPQLYQMGSIDLGPDTDSYNPAIGLNKFGDLGIVYCRSSATEYVSVCVAARSANDSPGTMRPAIVVKSSAVKLAHNSRFGDYPGVSVDPRDGTFWASQQYALFTGSYSVNWAPWMQQFGVRDNWKPFTGTIVIDGIQYDLKGQAKKK